MAQVRGVPETIKELRGVEQAMTRAEIDDVYDAAKSAAAALRAGVPRQPLSNMKGGPIRAHVERGSSSGRYYGMPGSRRLASVHLTAPVMTVISDMAAHSHGSTMVDNLYGKYARGPSRWVWPTVERFIPTFTRRIDLAIRRTEVKVNLRLRRRY